MTCPLATQRQGALRTAPGRWRLGLYLVGTHERAAALRPSYPGSGRGLIRELIATSGSSERRPLSAMMDSRFATADGAAWRLSKGALMDLGCYAVYATVGLLGPRTCLLKARQKVLLLVAVVWIDVRERLDRR